VKSVGGVGEKNLRAHLRVHCLGVDVGEGDAENERTQIVDIGDAAEGSERTLGSKERVFAALILRRAANAAVHHSLIVEIEIGRVAGPDAQLSAFKPAALREVFGAHGNVRASIRNPVNGVADDQAFVDELPKLGISRPVWRWSF